MNSLDLQSQYPVPVENGVFFPNGRKVGESPTKSDQVMSNEELLEYLDVPFLFWVCKKHPGGFVNWDGEIPSCPHCGAEKALLWYAYKTAIASLSSVKAKNNESNRTN